MNVKIIPTEITIDLKNAETPVKVIYLVELSTEKYTDVMGSGSTYISDSNVQKAIEQLQEAITNKIHSDLGLESAYTLDKTQVTQEEDL